MVAAASVAPFIEALTGFEPAYPGREFPFKGTGFSHFPTAPFRIKSQHSYAFGAFDCWLLRFMFNLYHSNYELAQEDFENNLTKLLALASNVAYAR